MLKFCKPLFLLLLIIFLNNFAFSQTLPELEKVKEIKLLEHTREDVRKILVGYKFNKDKKADFEDSFETENAKIHISYSNGKCASEDEDSYNWDVKEWKVIDIRVFPKNKLMLNEIKLNLSKYKIENIYKNSKQPKIYHNKNLGISIITTNGEIDSVRLEPPKRDFIKDCNKERAKRRLSTSSYFDPKYPDRYINFDPNESPNVENLILSFDGIAAFCSDSENKSCSNSIKIIAIFAYAKDLENDNMVYMYQVTGGKIIGSGAKVLWDLSDVKPGTYTITAAVDDGCGFCGKTMTKTITVKECPDCKKP